MVQNNRIKATTNHILSSLQYARQTAAINKTQVIACTPVPSDSENCALSNNWNNGVALLEGQAKVNKYTAPPPPKKPHAPEKPTFVSVPPLKAKPKKPPVQDRAFVYACEPRPSGGICETKIMTGMAPHSKYCPTTFLVSATYHALLPGKILHSESWKEYRCSGTPKEKLGHYDYHISERGPASQKAFKKVQQVVDDYNNNIDKVQDEYNEKLAEYNQSKKAHDDTKNFNQSLQAAYDSDLAAYNSAQQHYEQAMQKYNENLAKAPEQVITMDKANTILASNPFSVTVTPKLQGGVTAVIYNKGEVKNVYGQIYIEDKRGRGEHSRAICINMLGNLKVVKGNESCP